MKENKNIKKQKEEPLSSKLEKMKTINKEQFKKGQKEVITKLGSVTSAKNIFSNTKHSFYEKIKKKENPIILKAEISLCSQNYFKVSQTEIGLANFYKENKSLFLSRVMKGPPEYFRWNSWTIACDLSTQRSIENYNKYLNNAIDSKINTQILKDIHRTFAIDELINTEKAEIALYNVLKAYASCDSEVSYCQGMNFIAGFLLIVSRFNEVDTFYLMEKLFNSNFGQDRISARGFFTNEFPLLKLYVFQFNKLFQLKLPVVYNHFKELDIPSELWISKWIQTLFTMSLPWFLLIRVWDCLLVKGLIFIFSFSIAILYTFQKELLHFKDVSDISEFFKKMNPYKVFKGNDISVYNFENILEEALKINIEKSFLEITEKEYISTCKQENLIHELTKHTLENKTLSLEVEYSGYQNFEIKKGTSHKSAVDKPIHMPKINEKFSDSGNSISSENGDTVINNVKSHTLKINAKLTNDIKIGIRKRQLQKK